MITEKFTAVGVAILEVRGDGWSAGFYLKPDTAVKVTGNKPDLNAFRDSCALSEVVNKNWPPS